MNIFPTHCMDIFPEGECFVHNNICMYLYSHLNFSLEADLIEIIFLFL